MSNLRYVGAIIFYQDDQPILIKDGDYIEVELNNGRIKKGYVHSIDYWECGEIHLSGKNNDYSFDISQVKRIILVNEDTRRKVKLSDGQIHTYLANKGTKNPCECGSNCFHVETDNKTTYGVCNACDKDIYEYEFEEFAEWRYK